MNGRLKIRETAEEGKMNQVEVKECARRIQILTEAYSGLLECKKAAVEIPECHQYRFADH